MVLIFILVLVTHVHSTNILLWWCSNLCPVTVKKPSTAVGGNFTGELTVTCNNGTRTCDADVITIIHTKFSTAVYMAVHVLNLVC